MRRPAAGFFGRRLVASFLTMLRCLAWGSFVFFQKIVE